MRAAVTVERCRIEVQEVPDPEPAADEAVVSVGAVGLCGTDLHMWAGERPGVGFPLRQGHEIGAVVERLPADGSGAHLSVGDVVAVDPSFPCGACGACARGDWPSCARFTAYGVARPGGLAEAMAVPMDHLHPVPVSVEAAALVEPVSVAAMALQRSGARAGERIVVLGAGPIGLGLVLCGVAAGIGVLVADPLRSRLDVAAALGADAVVDVGAVSVGEAVRDWSGGDGPRAVVEASGSERAVRDSVALVGRGGRLVVVGLGETEVRIPVSRLLFDGIQVTGSRAGLFPEAARVVGSRPDAALRLVSHRFPLADVREAFLQAHDRPGSTVKVLVGM
jgi:threonine dehydrogenase-like Zn-dependent dehydrogenase